MIKTISKRRRKRIVVIGGGTGTSTILKGLREYFVDLSVIVTTADDGGSSGRLRREFGMPPPGDARQCLVALTSSNNKFAQYFNQRLEAGNLRGHSFGNIFLALLYQETKNFQKAIEKAEKFLDCQGQVIPVSQSPLTLCAALKDGRIIEGEGAITSSKEISKNLDHLYFNHGTQVNPKARKAILKADLVVVGPGNFFSSILPNFLIDGVSQVLRKSRAKKIYIANLLTQPGHTDGFWLQDFIAILAKYIGKDVFDKVLYNTQRISPETYARFSIEGREVVLKPALLTEARFIGLPFVSSEFFVPDPADSLTRTVIRHDSKKLAKAIMELF